ncbi:MAG: COX15/CtaA family protein [Pseudomonadota bacterium]
MGSIRYGAIGAATIAYCLIVLGAMVRTTGSGLACPDWPTCYGTWFPMPETVAAANLGFTYTQVMFEWVHRFVAAVILGPVILLVCFATFLLGEDRGLKYAGLSLVALLVVQGALGGLTVLDANSPWSVAIHLGNALLLMIMLLFVVVRTSFSRHQSSAKFVRPLSLAAVIVTLSAMVTAAMTAKSGASLACPSWPLCDGSLVPDLSDPAVQIHFAHRLLAACVGIVVLVLACFVSGSSSTTRLLFRGALILVVVQIGFGAGLIHWYIPVPLAVAHQALAVLIFMILALAFWLTWGVGRSSDSLPSEDIDRMRMLEADAPSRPA